MILGRLNCSGRSAECPEMQLGKNATPHLSFGGGAHLCLGVHLARLETQVAIGTLVRRFDELTLESELMEWGRSLFRGPGRIPVRFMEAPG